MDSDYFSFLNITNKLNARKRSYLHYHSFINFFNNYESIKSVNNKKKVAELLNGYIQFISDIPEDQIDRNMGMTLVNPYLFAIGKVYKREISFKEILPPKFLFAFTFIIDLFLILFGLEIYRNIPIPLISIATILYYYFYLNSDIKNGKVFGIFW